MSPRVDPAEAREAVAACLPWLRDADAAPPERVLLARAVRLTARTLAANAPGHSVEVRVPPFVAVQCLPGPRHNRGTPPNVVETDPRTWLLLVTGLLDFDGAVSGGGLRLSGSRAAELRQWLPLFGHHGVETP